MWVSPFRHLRLIGYLLLPEAFRSLSRLSSALSAKASTLRSFLLGHSDLIALTSDGWCCLVCFYFFAVFLQRLVSSLSYVLRILDVSYMQFSRYIKMRAHLKILNLLSHIWLFYQPFKHKNFLCLNHWQNHHLLILFFVIRQPPAFPCRLQHSIIGRLSLNHRVRDGNGCLP